MKQREQPTDQSKERFAEPGNVLSQWWTLGRLLKDRRRAASHDAVYWVVLNSRDSRTGICRASMSFIAEALDGAIASRETIKKALHDLAEWGYVKPLPRRRRNDATKFEIPWVISSRGLVHQTTKVRGLEEQTAGGLAEQTASGLVDQTESYLPPDGSTGGEVGKVSAAPDADGLTATAPASGFEDGWKAYGRHGSKAKSRDAWAAIDFTQYDYGPEHVIERAQSWAASAKPGAKRMPFEKWLEQERYDEADRAVQPKPKKASLETVTSEPSIHREQMAIPANDNNPAPRLVRIISSRKEETERSRAAIFNAVAEDGETIEIYISYEHQWQWAQEAGQQNLVELARAVGIEAFEDTEDFHDIPFLLGQNEAGGHTYLPVPSRAKGAQHA